MKCLRTILMFMTVASAADSCDWSAVTGIKAGSRIEVIHSGLKRSSGRLIAATSQDVTIETAAGQQVLPRSEVRRVSLHGTSRNKRVLTGLAIGAGVGATALVLGANRQDIDIRRGLVAGLARHWEAASVRR